MTVDEATVTAAGPDEIGELARLETACLADPWSRDDLTLYIGSGAVVGFLLREPPPGGAASAYALFQLLPGECELLRVGVAPPARRRGLARRLLGDALVALRAGGHGVCHLEVRAGNGPARALYEALGFRVAGQRRGYYADGEDAVRYRLEAASDGG